IRTPFNIEIEYWNLKPDTRLNLSMALYNEEEACVFTTTTAKEPCWHGKPFPSGLFRSVCHVPGDLLNDGRYRLDLLIVQDSGHILHREQEALTFELHDDPHDRGGSS